ncbi:T9SS type A sorting domain-containing protein [Chryseobacterium tongliaoense]|uniref:T9SS type A sorting domain-containing protein n=1 Tax=Chryseobacterium tongliaoense TaxID=3240933 RepID=UPI003519B983
MKSQINKGNLVNDAGAGAPQNYSILVTGYSEVLGTNEAGKTNEIIISPTIIKDFVNVLKAPKKSTYSLYDLSGKKLQAGSISSDKKEIDLSTYANGIYILEVKTDKEVISKKLIKE